MEPSTALITNDAVVLGILLSILAFVFFTSSKQTGGWKRFYSIIPSLLLCYFLPSLLATDWPLLPFTPIISGENSQIYYVASRFLLPASLVLLTLSIDIKGIVSLGPKAIIMFFTGTIGILVGGPLTVFLVSLVSPETVGGQGPDAVWRGLTTIAGSWIGGGANQVAMKEVFEVGDDVFSALVAVDVIVANIWMAVLLFFAGNNEAVDRFLKADSSAITRLRDRVAEYHAQMARIPKLADLMLIIAVGLGVTGLAHAFASGINADTVGISGWVGTNFPQLAKFSLTSSFFWIVVVATTAGLILSFTKARALEGAGASRVGSAFLYVLVASIGMKMDLMAIFRQPGLFVVGAIWISFHAGLLLFTAWLIKAPIFFAAVGSQANVGGAASAPIVASAFHPALAPVGVLLAVLGYALGTYAAWLCGILMQSVAP